MEMTQSVYRLLDSGGVNRPSSDQYEEADATEVDIKTPYSGQRKEGPNPQHSGPWKTIAMCLGLLCAVLLSGITVLSFEVTKISHNNQMKGTSQVQASSSDLRNETAQLQDSHKHLSETDMMQLQRDYSNLKTEKSNLQISNNNLVREKSQLQYKYNNLNREKSQLQANYSNLNSEKSQLQDRYNDLSSEKSRLQTSYNNLNSEKSQLQDRYNDLSSEKSRLQTSYNNLNSGKSQLQERYNDLSSEKSRLQISYNNLNSEKSQLQDRYNDLNSEKSQLQGRLNTTAAKKDELTTAAEKDELLRRFCEAKMDVTQYAVEMALDPDTADDHLTLSADGKQVIRENTRQHLPYSAKRFLYYAVQGTQGFSSGRSYYEVQVNVSRSWELGVVRESCNRRAVASGRNPNNGYWIIKRSGSSYRAGAAPSVLLSLKEDPERVGVFVDYDAGLVSFYDADMWALVYSFKGVSFRKKMYPYLYAGDSFPLSVVTPVSCVL
ncbi:E3 ubiquitin-protein ligase TRIM38-like isoform X1 [Alosa sapidissima]|uniref:E3 ubiquitin-protein ligase TRIM38-like isoform X1 n=1 Tax=Alosa sapidissima TaxID=34773 RepID=UPI001C09B233|nr:E3 ubiquitin-protein ligase TRIM38-like isoform X1 [Alosa sapidissima]XP_041926999.1 E3 ubiquitin-protein ligase TRIM38-like isoform X1 [Alosa sapidissima]XP_041927000.1 E3 ubiquitin-protein ligase TRIM38-like isoform X1 [Alosa sapidissima]XP_041927001.1 E3 ubiquitin-protein ligase TRIM38-like isoform X1 [Alosa sapidissima]